MTRRLLVPCLLLAAVFALDLYLVSHYGPSWREDPRLLRGLRLLVILVFALAWRLRRGRMAWALATTWGVAEAMLRLGGFATAAEAPALVVALASAVLLPLHLAAAARLTEWRVAGRAGLVRFGVLGAEAVVLYFLATDTGRPVWTLLASPLASLRLHLEGWFAAASIPGLLGQHATLDAYALPVLRLAAFVVAAAVVAWTLRRRATPLEAGFLGALVAIFPATLRGDLVLPAFGAAVLVLGVALVENTVRLAFDDGLTGLPARRALEECLDQLSGRYALAMVDIDHFKNLNDRHGHEVGDQVLRKVAARLGRVQGGQAFRYGGEEFALVFPGRTVEEAETAVEAVRRAVADQPFEVRSPTRPKKGSQGKARRGQGGGEKSLSVTVSAGVSLRTDARPGPRDVLKAADRALYRSKKAGRNRVTVAR